MIKIFTSLAIATVMTAAFAQSTNDASKNPVEEWQINGGNVNPYNGLDTMQETSSTNTMHRTRHRVRRVKHHSM